MEFPAWPWQFCPLLACVCTDKKAKLQWYGYPPISSASSHNISFSYILAYSLSSSSSKAKLDVNAWVWNEAGRAIATFLTHTHTQFANIFSCIMIGIQFFVSSCMPHNHVLIWLIGFQVSFWLYSEKIIAPAQRMPHMRLLRPVWWLIPGSRTYYKCTWANRSLAVIWAAVLGKSVEKIVYRLSQTGWNVQH